MRWLTPGLICVVALCGCGSPDQTIPLRERVITLEQSEQSLKEQIALRDQTISEQKKQIQNLIGLKPDVLALLIQPASIAIQDGTAPVPNIGSPGFASCRVVVAPMDSAGQPLRVPGQFAAKVFDLQSTPPKLIGELVVPPTECKNIWFTTLMGSYYCFNVPLKEQPTGPTVTVSVQYTDAISGKELTAQQMVGVPKGGPVASQPVAAAN